MEHNEEVAIVGGGPAGAYCAYELARRGIHATIIDGSHPREKPCGGGISTATVKMFPFVERLRSNGRNCSKFKMLLFDDKEVVAAESNVAFVISRQRFDQEILSISTQNGAKLIREKVADIKRKRNYWQIRTDRQLLNAKILVGADGVNSIVRRKTVGAISREDLGLGFGYYATGIEKEPVTVKFTAEFPGYIWIFPRSDHTSIGVGSQLKHGSLLKKILDNFIHLHYPQMKFTSRFAAMFPFAENPDFFSLPCAGTDWVLVGDAAGHVDPISGEGILYALWSGKLAADVIARNALGSYDELWRQEYGDGLRERCKRKSEFYDPFRLTLSFILGSADKTLSWRGT